MRCERRRTDPPRRGTIAEIAWLINEYQKEVIRRFPHRDDCILLVLVVVLVLEIPEASEDEDENDDEEEGQNFFFKQSLRSLETMTFGLYRSPPRLGRIFRMAETNRKS
jgi:hypothetical protein